MINSPQAPRPRVLKRLSRYGLLYLATPYTLHKDGKDMAYQEAVAILGRLHRDTGLPFYSPIVHWHDASKTEFLKDVQDSDWLKINRPIMSACGAMVVPDFNGWKASAGIEEEVIDFRSAGKPIFLIDQITFNVVRRLDARSSKAS